MVEAITQGRCTECGESDDNYTVDERTYHERPDTDDKGDWNGIQRDISCDCGAEATVSITEEGIVAVGPISHDDATWNESDE